MVKCIASIEEFHSLLNYYISCLEKEEILSLTFNFRLDGKKFHSNIFKKEQFFLDKTEQIEIKKTPEIEKIFNDYNLLKKNVPIFYGYPLFIDSNGNVSPVFFVEILFEEKDDSIIFTKESVFLEFNHYILTKQDYNVEEINKFRLEIKEGDGFIIKLEKIIDLLNLEKKIISPEVAEKFTGVVGFRNILVHEYADIDYKLAYSNLADKLEDLKQFAREVLGFLERKN